MDDKVGRNDPCPCGSGKKYKQCCMQKSAGGSSLLKKKFTAKVISAGGEHKAEQQARAAAQVEVNLMDRTFGQAIEQAKEEGKPPVPTSQRKYYKKENH